MSEEDKQRLIKVFQKNISMQKNEYKKLLSFFLYMV